MRVATAIVRKPVNWIIGPDFPDLVPLTSLRGWSLVNPLLLQPDLVVDCTSPSGGNERVRLVSSRTLAFALPGQDRRETVAKIELVLKRMRYLSGQAPLPTEVGAFSCRDLEVLPAPPERVKEVQSDPVPYIRSTAVTFAVILRLASESVEEVPLFAACLLDAMEAFNQRDFKKAILLSATGAEIVARSCAEGQMRDLLASNATPNELRIVALPASKGRPERSDPVYDALSKRARRDFRVLLHELPLYVLQRSLLLEDKDLYDRACILREERNSLAHEWTRKPTGPLKDRERAACALDCARQVFSWFRVEGNYTLPDEARSIVDKHRC
jgi:hypothetical protein